MSKIKKLTEGGGGGGREGGGEGGGGEKISIIITSSRCKLFCGLFLGKLIPCRKSFQVLVPCGGGILYWYW